MIYPEDLYLILQGMREVNEELNKLPKGTYHPKIGEYNDLFHQLKVMFKDISPEDLIKYHDYIMNDGDKLLKEKDNILREERAEWKDKLKEEGNRIKDILVKELGRNIENIINSIK